jgi:hypothetical protein
MKKYVKMKCTLKSDDYGKSWFVDEAKYLAQKNHPRESYEFADNTLIDMLEQATFIMKQPPKPQEKQIPVVVEAVGEIET